ncbi:MAG: protein adenylyltransferase SelO family protein, partial [Ilumatobacter sp.]
RALAVATTGEMVRREGLLPGAVLTRIASSHLRVGTFQFFSARGDTDRLRRLVAYAIERHEPSAAAAENPTLAFLDGVVERQSALIAQWMNLGFIHGVMNTDNVTVSGETIDYGPCAFMDHYDPATVYSSIDHGGRYAYGNQPTIGLWNMARLAEALLPLIDDDPERAVELAMTSLDRYQGRYDAAWLAGMRAKLGLDDDGDDGDDRALATDWIALLQADRVDMTTAFRRLADTAAGDSTVLTDLFDGDVTEWLDRWNQRVGPDAGQRIRRVNPVYIPRNHLVEYALESAVQGDLLPFDELLAAVIRPYDERPGFERFEPPAPDGFSAGHQTFCGT